VKLASVPTVPLPNGGRPDADASLAVKVAAAVPGASAEDIAGIQAAAKVVSVASVPGPNLAELEKSSAEPLAFVHAEVPAGKVFYFC
jgi:hypothetical protein